MSLYVDSFPVAENLGVFRSLIATTTVAWTLGMTRGGDIISVLYSFVPIVFYAMLQDCGNHEFHDSCEAINRVAIPAVVIAVLLGWLGARVTIGFTNTAFFGHISRMLTAFDPASETGKRTVAGVFFQEFLSLILASGVVWSTIPIVYGSFSTATPKPGNEFIGWELAVLCAGVIFQFAIGPVMAAVFFGNTGVLSYPVAATIGEESASGVSRQTRSPVWGGRVTYATIDDMDLSGELNEKMRSSTYWKHFLFSLVVAAWIWICYGITLLFQTQGHWLIVLVVTLPWAILMPLAAVLYDLATEPRSSDSKKTMPSSYAQSMAASPVAPGTIGGYTAAVVAAPARGGVMGRKPLSA
jgi:hypothetical protein